MKSLYTQLKYELKRFNATDESIETVFIGGGTPSTISPKLYAPIFDLLKPYLACGIEITSEANPNSATKKWLSGMWNLGINRISFGVQSFDDKKLKVLNRAHSAKDAKTAIIDAKEIGFENISLDLIYATLNDTKELLQNDIKTAFSLPINHLSAYALTIEEGTPFEKKPQMSNESLELTSWIFNKIKSNNFEQYEISNFGTYKSLHNLGYWQYKDYIGVGSGAVGKLNNERFYPTPILEDFIKNPLNIKTELLSNEDMKTEKIFLGFRSSVGVNENILTNYEKQRAQILVKENKLDFVSNIFYNLDYLLADELALFLTY
jgi:oxygen-independent coproporphyrinogen-3 oxidase